MTDGLDLLINSNSQMNVSECAICGNSDFSVFHQVSDYLMDAPDLTTSFMSCDVCGLIFQNPRLSQSKIHEYYPPEYDSYQDIELYPDDLYSRIATRGLLKRSQVVIDNKGSGKLLDVGCATGNFLRMMQKFPGWDLQGVEISEHAAKIARENYQLNVYTGVIEEANYPADHFDVVTLWDVLEHILDPNSLLFEVNRVLKSSGNLILRVPNGGSWDAKLFGKFWSGLDAPRHYYVFDRNTITRLLELSGFRIKKLDCSIGGSVAFPLDVRFYLAGKGVSEKWQRVIWNVVSHPITKFIMLPITYLFDHLLMGSFLVVVAEKRR